MDSPDLIRRKQHRLQDIEKHGKAFQGRAEFIAILKGKHVPASKAIRAYCYDCQGYFADGAADCGDPVCPLYKWMPYAGKKQSEPAIEHAVDSS